MDVHMSIFRVYDTCIFIYIYSVCAYIIEVCKIYSKYLPYVKYVWKKKQLLGIYLKYWNYIWDMSNNWNMCNNSNTLNIRSIGDTGSNWNMSFRYWKYNEIYLRLRQYLKYLKYLMSIDEFLMFEKIESLDKHTTVDHSDACCHILVYIYLYMNDDE
jgi:hypothetical protein